MPLGDKALGETEQALGCTQHEVGPGMQHGMERFADLSFEWIGKIDEHIAAEDEVKKSLDTERLLHVHPAEFHHASQFRPHFLEGLGNHLGVEEAVSLGRKEVAFLGVKNRYPLGGCEAVSFSVEEGVFQEVRGSMWNPADVAGRLAKRNFVPPPDWGCQGRRYSRVSPCRSVAKLSEISNRLSAAPSMR